MFSRGGVAIPRLGTPPTQTAKHQTFIRPPRNFLNGGKLCLRATELANYGGPLLNSKISRTRSLWPTQRWPQFARSADTAASLAKFAPKWSKSRQNRPASPESPDCGSEFVRRQVRGPGHDSQAFESAAPAWKLPEPSCSSVARTGATFETELRSLGNDLNAELNEHRCHGRECQ